jgi:hypothetical protein
MWMFIIQGMCCSWQCRCHTADYHYHQLSSVPPRHYQNLPKLPLSAEESHSAWAAAFATTIMEYQLSLSVGWALWLSIPPAMSSGCRLHRVLFISGAFVAGFAVVLIDYILQ